jgi:lipopolysaccharide biosynthesis glycosyltransferase
MAVTPFRIFIGWDQREAVAYHVLCDSILRHASGPVSFMPLVQSQLRRQRLYTRPHDPLASTEFSLTRFLVPYLAGYTGMALFLDCDMLFQSDVYDLLVESDAHPGQAVYVCQHQYRPAKHVKFLGQTQSAYPRKNWSSVMLFNADLCRMLTPHYINRVASPSDLHQFAWLGDQDIGPLPLAWNYLVGEENQTQAKPDNIHYTCGGPWFRDYQTCEHAQAWFDALDLAFPSLNVPKPVEVA